MSASEKPAEKAPEKSLEQWGIVESELTDLRDRLARAEALAAELRGELEQTAGELRGALARGDSLYGIAVAYSDLAAEAVKRNEVLAAAIERDGHAASDPMSTKNLILDYIVATGVRGATSEEVYFALPVKTRQTVATQIDSLLRNGQIRVCGTTWDVAAECSRDVFVAINKGGGAA